MARENESGAALKRWGFWGGAALVAVLLIAYFRGAFSASDVKEAFGTLSDSCLIVGVMLSGVGGLDFAASRGAYDSLGYVVSRFSLHSLLPTGKKDAKADTLYDYKTQKDRKGRTWSPPILVSGLAALAMSAVFLALYAAA